MNSTSEHARRETADNMGMLAHVSHEMRNILNGLLGYLDLINGDLSQNENERHLDKARQSGHYLQYLINQTLDFAKLAAGEYRTQPQDIAVPEWLSDTLDVFRANAQQKRLRLQYTLDDTVPDCINIDVKALNHIIRNLLSNALKFTSRGSVSLHISVAENASIPMLIFRVKDTGIGIDPADQGRIFQPFQQAQHTQQGGTGLGLSLCSGFAEALGGTLSVESVVGEGSSFILTVPFIPNKTDTGMAADFVMQTQTAMIVLADTTQSTTLARLLRWLGANVVACSSAPEALFHLRQQTINSNGPAITLLIADAQLPGMSGDRLFNEVAHSGIKPLPFCLLLDPTEEHRASCVADAIVHSPVTLSDLLSLPLMKAKPPKHAPETTNARILLVEDTPLNQELFLGQMQLLGQPLVVITSSGQEALDRLTHETFDIIFMDIMMPGMDGVQTTEHIRRQYSAEALPIVAITANLVGSDISKYLTAGFNDVLAKPYAIHQLQAVLSRFLSWPESPSTKLEPVHEQNAQTQDDTLSWHAALTRVGGDEELLIAILHPFLAELPSKLEKMEQALVENDAALMQRQAHSLKGLLRTFGADAAAKVSEQLEHAAKYQNQVDMMHAFKALAEPLAEAQKALYARVTPSS
ncbi:response regulator [Salinispirillum marinum]|uniref:histidine kinase n=2 Tax=Saccharospirillaceae TaxID=255527 RepID=A0ABV8BK55_9GAMM